MTHQSLLLRAVAAAMVLAAPSIARAQDAAQAGPNQSGPMTVELVTEHYALVPEVKATSFDGITGVLVGGHGGVLLGRRLLVGAGLYTLTNGSRGQGLTYGGGEVGWNWWNGTLLAADVRGLVGMGQGSIARNLTLTDRQGRSFSQTRFESNDFFVAEPQANLLIRLTRHLHLDVGAGYRFTNADRGVGDQFNGAIGSVGLRIGPAQ